MLAEAQAKIAEPEKEKATLADKLDKLHVRLKATQQENGGRGKPRLADEKKQTNEQHRLLNFDAHAHFFKIISHVN